MINALFIVWRECFEALLIVMILYSYLHRRPDGKAAMGYMWAGVGTGGGLSALLAFALQTAQTELQGQAIEYFQIALLVLAAILMTQMCIWMKRHARKLKAELEQDMSGALGKARLYGVAGLTALAIAREGFELVMFFYGMVIEATEKNQMGELLAYAGGGVALTVLTGWAVQKGLGLFRQKLFFQITTGFLLVTAGSLILLATRKLVQMDVLPTLRDQIWDTSFVLDERGGVGRVISSLTGYESTPALVTVLIYAVYWAVTVFFFTRASQAATAPAPSR